MIDSQDNGWGAGEVPISLAYVKDPPSKCSPKILLIDRISDRRSNGLLRWRLCLACEQMICELARACANKAQTTSNVTSNERVFRPHSPRGFGARSCSRPIALPQQSRELRRLEFQPPVTVEFVFRLWSLPLQTRRLPSSQSADKKTGDTWTETASQV